MLELEVIKRQPDFPNEDLASENVALMEFYLQATNEARSHARLLEESMRPVHLTAHYALQLAGVEVKYTPEEYEAFCKGFAAFEYVSLLVNPRDIPDKLVVRNTRNLLTAGGVFSEAELALRRERWVQTYVNMGKVVMNSGLEAGETPSQLHSRTIGAQVACELQAKPLAI